MYKDIEVPVWKFDKITKVYQRWSWRGKDVVGGWYYKIGRKEFGIYDSKVDAEASLFLRLKDYSWRD